MIKLKFSQGNAKLSGFIATFSLPAGHSCPNALDCLCKSDRITGKLTDGPETKFRCFSATGEARATSVRNARWFNYELILNTYKEGGLQAVVNLIQASLPDGATAVRLHVSGDFFAEWYLKAWLNVALANPNMLIYGYTKSLKFWVDNKHHFPANFRLTASKGGRQDNLIAEHGLKFAEVVFSEAEAAAKGLEIDHDDSLAMNSPNSFALLLHATQPAGTPAAEAWKSIMKTVGGYRRGEKRHGAPAKQVELAVV